MLFIINILTFLRLPLALLFMVDSLYCRLAVLGLAMITDFLDGYLARHYSMATRFGAIFDPIMDKFFVLFIGSILLIEGKLAPLELVIMVSRDVFLLFFGVYLALASRQGRIVWESEIWGKITTVFQFIVLFALSLGVIFPIHMFLPFILLGMLTVRSSYCRFTQDEIPIPPASLQEEQRRVG